MKFSTKAAGAAVFVLSLLGGTSAFAQTAVADATVAFLMPDQGSTRYEEHDHPGFVAEMKKLCASCKVLYQNADADIAKQQQQFNSAITQGAKVIVLDPVDSAAAASLVQLAQSQGSRSLPMTVLSRRARPISTSPSITRRSARQLRNRSSSI